MKIKIKRKAYLKLKYFIQECDSEISGFGKIRKRRGEFEVYDIEVLAQTVSGVHATIKPEDLVKFMTEKMQGGQSTEDYKVWWHSHVNMQVFFSTTDVQTIDESTEFPYLVSIVGNKKEEYKARVDVYEPLRMTEEVELEIEGLEDNKLKEECAEEVKEKVKKEKVIEKKKEHESFTYEPYEPWWRKTHKVNDENEGFINDNDVNRIIGEERDDD